MARHGLRTWCTGHTQACRALAQAQYKAPAPAPLQARQPGFPSNGLGAQAVHKCSAPQAAGSQAAEGNDERLSVLAPALGPFAPSNGALLSLIVRKNGQLH